MAEACAWPVTYTACGDVGEEPGEIICASLAALDPEERQRFEEMAADLLWRWTGGVFGVCPVEVRPCRDDCTGSDWSTFGGPLRAPNGLSTSGSGSPWSPVLIGGAWFNVSCGSCLNLGCTCDPEGPASIRLPGPIASVTSVMIDGEVLDPSAYVVDRKTFLRRIDGGRWPSCQRLDLPATEPGTWQVVYERGIDVPVGGQVAAGVLACEFAKAACGDDTCRLPANVRSVTRQGVSVDVLTEFADVKEGRTGIWLIDSWVASIVAPPRRGASVRSPDVRPKAEAWRLT